MLNDLKKHNFLNVFEIFLWSFLFFLISLLETDGLVTDTDYQADGLNPSNRMKFTLLYSSSGEDVFSVDPFTNAVGDVTQTGRLELNKVN